MDEDTKETLQIGHVHLTAEMQGNQQGNKETLHKKPKQGEDDKCTHVQNIKIFLRHHKSSLIDN